MKSNTKIKIILGILVIIFPLSTIIYNNPSFNGGNIEESYENLKHSKVSEKIHIVGNQGWVDFKNDGNCTGSGISTDPYVISDLEIDAGGSGSGIIIENSDLYFKIKNSTIWNSGASFGDGGISLKGVVNGLIENNTLYDNWHAIRLDNSDNNLILNNTILGSYYIGIYFYANSQYNNVSKNILKNGVRAVRSLFTNSNITIYNNTMISNTYGIYLSGVNHTITDNIIKENSYGIRIDDSHDSKIFRNIINGSEFYGLYVLDSDNVKIVNNAVKYGKSTAIRVVRCDYSELINNTLSFNGLNDNNHGVFIASSNNVSILNNKIDSNTGSGVYISGEYGTTDYNKIINNKIRSNGFNGVYLYLSSHNNISENTLEDDSGTEFFLEGNNNLIYANNFINSLYTLAVDLGNNNKWNSSSIGNYWSSYTGVDANDDGIGDTSYYIIIGSYDFLPIWWDSPQILINSPTENDTFELSPTFNISVSRGNVNSSWYTLNKGIKNITFTGLNGVIDKVEWNKKGVGPVLITFYVNDSKGYLSFKTVQVFKYHDRPQIAIISPTINQVYGFNAPDFVIVINDSSSINSTWYTIDGGSTNYTFSGLTDFINQSRWGQKEDGALTIRFYANDSLGNLGFEDVNVIKDTTAPKITIHAPTINQTFGSMAPDFNISIVEENLYLTWYIIQENLTEYNFTVLDGTFDQNAWNTTLEGQITITFYAQDSAGNIGTEIVIVIKRIPSQPSIPGYNIYLLFGIVFFSLIIALKKKQKS